MQCGWYKIISGMIVVGSRVINFVYIKYINSLGAVIASFVPTNGLHPSKNPIFTFRVSVSQKSLTLLDAPRAIMARRSEHYAFSSVS